MPTRINLDIRAPRQNPLDQFNVFAPNPAPRGFDEINRRITKDQAQEILRGLKTQLDDGRGGIKSGYLKIVNTTVEGNHMEIQRKGRFHAWMNRGRMESTNQALLTIVERSGLASGQQIETLRQYLNAKHKAGTKTLANFLKTLSLGETGPIGTFIASHSAEHRTSQFNAAVGAAGLINPLDPSSLPEGFASLRSFQAQLTALRMVADANPTATPSQLGRFANAWMKYPHGDEQPDLGLSSAPFPDIKAIRQIDPSETIQARSDFLTAAFSGMEERIAPWIKLQACFADSSTRDTLTGVADHIATQLLIPSGNHQADALRQSVAQDLQQIRAQNLLHSIRPSDSDSQTQLGALTENQSVDNSDVPMSFQSSPDCKKGVIRNSRYSNSVLAINLSGALQFDRVNLDGSLLEIAPTSLPSSISGLATCSLERTSIYIHHNAIGEFLADRKDNESDAAVRRRLDKAKKWVGATNQLIASIPDRYAGIKVNLAMDLISALGAAGESNKFLCAVQIASVIATVPELLNIPEAEAVYKSAAEVMFNEAIANNPEASVRLTAAHLQLAQKSPVAKAFLDQSEAFKNVKALALISRSDADPRKITLEERNRFVSVFLTMNDDARSRWLSAHSAATAIALQPRAGESALIDPSNGEPARDASDQLIAAHKLLIKHPGIRDALFLWAQGVDYSITEDNHDDESDAALLQTSLVSAVILNETEPAANAHHAVVLRDEALTEFIEGKPINAHLTDMMKVYVLDRRAQDPAAQNAGAISSEQTKGMRRFDKSLDTSIAPLLREAVVKPNQDIVTTTLAYHFKSEALRKLFEQSIDRRSPISGDQAVAILEVLQGFWMEDPPRVSDSYLAGLRQSMGELGIANTNANFSAYLFQLASVFTRFSSVASMGTDSESVTCLRAHAARLLKHANEIAPKNPESRLVPNDAYIKELIDELNTNQCSDILSRHMMLPAGRSKAPDIFAITVPAAWLVWGNGNAPRIRGVAP